jgi:periplasmic divalent cation tolerance protein
MKPTLLIYCTVKDRADGERIGSALVEQQMAACVNVIDGLTSIYRWKGEVQKETEALLIAKTTEDRYSALEKTILALHSYECPCIVALPITRGYAGFLEWIQAQVTEC